MNQKWGGFTIPGAVTWVRHGIVFLGIHGHQCTAAEVIWMPDTIRDLVTWTGWTWGSSGRMAGLSECPTNNKLDGAKCDIRWMIHSVLISMLVHDFAADEMVRTNDQGERTNLYIACHACISPIS